MPRRRPIDAAQERGDESLTLGLYAVAVAIVAFLGGDAWRGLGWFAGGTGGSLVILHVAAPRVRSVRWRIAIGVLVGAIWFGGCGMGVWDVLT